MENPQNMRFYARIFDSPLMNLMDLGSTTCDLQGFNQPLRREFARDNQRIKSWHLL